MIAVLSVAVVSAPALLVNNFILVFSMFRIPLRVNGYFVLHIIEKYIRSHINNVTYYIKWSNGVLLEYHKTISHAYDQNAENYS